MAPSDFDYYRVKVLHICVTNVPESQTSQLYVVLAVAGNVYKKFVIISAEGIAF